MKKYDLLLGAFSKFKLEKIRWSIEENNKLNEFSQIRDEKKKNVILIYYTISCKKKKKKILI